MSSGLTKRGRPPRTLVARDGSARRMRSSARWGPAVGPQPSRSTIPPRRPTRMAVSGLNESMGGGHDRQVHVVGVDLASPLRAPRRPAHAPPGRCRRRSRRAGHAWSVRSRPLRSWPDPSGAGPSTDWRGGYAHRGTGHRPRAHWHRRTSQPGWPHEHPALLRIRRRYHSSTWPLGSCWLRHRDHRRDPSGDRLPAALRLEVKWQ